MTYQQKIKEFAVRIAPVYSLLGWHWALPLPHIPTAYDIETSLLEMCDRVIAGKTTWTRCGGLWAERDQEDGTLNFGFESTEVTGSPCAVSSEADDAA